MLVKGAIGVHIIHAKTHIANTVRGPCKQTHRASWTGTSNVGKDAQGMGKRGKDWKRSIVRRPPGHAFLWPDPSYKDPDCLSARSLWGYKTVSDKETKGIATPDLSGTLFICSMIISTLRDMTRHYDMIIATNNLVPISHWDNCISDNVGPWAHTKRTTSLW